MNLKFVPIRNIIKRDMENHIPDKSEFQPCKKEVNIAETLQGPGVNKSTNNVKNTQNNHSSGSTNPEVNKVDAEPKLTINRQGNRIESIVIECQCGKKVTLNCLYEVFPTNI